MSRTAAAPVALLPRFPYSSRTHTRGPLAGDRQTWGWHRDPSTLCWSVSSQANKSFVAHLVPLAARLNHNLPGFCILHSASRICPQSTLATARTVQDPEAYPQFPISTLHAGFISRVVQQSEPRRRANSIQSHLLAVGAGPS